LPVDEAGRPTPGVEALAALAAGLRARHGFDGLGTTPAMRRVAEQARLAAGSRVCVTVRGEPGAGKTWVARAIHHQGVTRAGPFAVLDCGRLPGVAVAAALFEGGRLVRRAGTVLLREPGCLPLDLQSVLSAWLSEIGPEAPRVISSVQTPPAGGLGEDLAAALSTLVIDVPPLRERLADLPAIAGHLLRELGDGAVLTREALAVLLAHRWPGNLRELARV